MLPSSTALLRAIQCGLLISAFGWSLSFVFLFSSWPEATEQLQAMGGPKIPYHPLMDYWLRMTAVTFGSIGLISILACAWPHRFEALIILLIPFHAVVGTTLLIAALKNDLSPAIHSTFIPDIAFWPLVATLVGIPLLIDGSFRLRLSPSGK